MHFRDAAAPVFVFQSRSVHVNHDTAVSKSTLLVIWPCYSDTSVLFFSSFQKIISLVQCPQFPRDALNRSLCLNLSRKMDKWL